MGFGDQLAGASCWGGPTARVGGGVVPLSFTSPPLSCRSGAVGPKNHFRSPKLVFGEVFV